MSEWVIPIKIFAAACLIVGITMGGVSLYLEPDHLILEQSRRRPSWLPWLGWITASIASILYLVVDYLAHG